MFKLLQRRTDNIAGFVLRLLETLDIDLQVQMKVGVVSVQEILYLMGAKIFQFEPKSGLESKIWSMRIFKVG